MRLPIGRAAGVRAAQPTCPGVSAKVRASRPSSTRAAARRGAPPADAGASPPAAPAAPPGRGEAPAPAPAVEWDPDGLLPPKPAGGHFARRKEGKVAAAAAAAPAAAAPAADAPAAAPGAARAAAPGAAPAAAPAAADRAFPAAPGVGVGAAVEAAFLEVFAGAAAAPRVLESFRRLRRGEEFAQLHPGLGLQRADSYVAGLSAAPFPDPAGGAYPWLLALERQAGAVQAEFAAATAGGDAALAARGNNVWVPAARAEALAYGPDWRTLVVQDRGAWDPVNSRLFPRTKKILTDAGAPTLEVFFARQAPRSGIAPHTDGANFVQTSHLGLAVPEGRCWIKVGDHTREWRNGKVIVCDTSFIHETRNDADEDRVVLIVRHWHPELTPLERRALAFLFAALDDPSAAGIRAAQRDAAARLKADAAAAARGRRGAGGGGGGFGGGAPRRKA